MNIIKTVGNTTTILASATTFDTHAWVESTSGLTGASATGGITKGSSRSTMTMTLTQAKCSQDEGKYACKITILRYNATHKAYDHKNLIIQGEALTLQTLKLTWIQALAIKKNDSKAKQHQSLNSHCVHCMIFC